MADLQTRIQEAEAAAAELARLERLRDELPELRAEQARLEQEDRARAALAAAQADARQALATYKTRLEPFRAEFAAYVKQGEQLAAQLGQLEVEIPQAARALAVAIANAQRSGLPAEHAAGAWCSLGWCDPGLQAVPDRNDGRAFRAQDLDEKIGALLAEKAGIQVYKPERGIRGAGVNA
jgi:hypothetical protein